jgi:hypothetical protein
MAWLGLSTQGRSRPNRGNREGRRPHRRSWRHGSAVQRFGGRCRPWWGMTRCTRGPQEGGGCGKTTRRKREGVGELRPWRGRAHRRHGRQRRKCSRRALPGSTGEAVTSMGCRRARWKGVLAVAGGSGPPAANFVGRAMARGSERKKSLGLLRWSEGNEGGAGWSGAPWHLWRRTTAWRGPRDATRLAMPTHGGHGAAMACSRSRRCVHALAGEGDTAWAWA